MSNYSEAIEGAWFWGAFHSNPLPKNPQRRNISPQTTTSMACLVAAKTQLETQRDHKRNVADCGRCVSVSLFFISNT